MGLRPKKGLTYLIVEHERRHCIVRRGWKLYDSYCPGGEFVRRYPFRKLMVGTAWEIEDPTEQLCLPFKEYWLRRDYY